MTASQIIAVIGAALAVAVIAGYLVALAVLLWLADRRLAAVADDAARPGDEPVAVASSFDRLAEELEALRDRLDRVPSRG